MAPFSNEFKLTRISPHHIKRKPTDWSVMKFLKNLRNSENTGKNLLTAFRWLGICLQSQPSVPIVLDFHGGSLFHRPPRERESHQ